MVGFFKIDSTIWTSGDLLFLVTAEKYLALIPVITLNLLMLFKIPGRLNMIQRAVDYCKFKLAGHIVPSDRCA
ncbi:hypothetical protein BTJ40_14375 [Microbulbifer sp. A4B17]|nr:hypothetical protein BTJ40_14375 [Microbulbifer sp. A4B17]